MLMAIGLMLSAASIWFIGGKKHTYYNVRTVKARAYQVFPYLTDPELKKKWQDNLMEQRLVSDAMEEGAELRTVIEEGEKTIEFEDHVIRFAKNEVVSIRSRGADVTSTSFVRLKPRGEDTTEIDFRRIVKLGGLKRFMSVFGEDLNQQALDDDLAKLIKLIEDETDHTIPDPDAMQKMSKGDGEASGENAAEGAADQAQTSNSAG